MSYTTEFDEAVKKGIAFQREAGTPEEVIILRIETIVAAAVLEHVRSNQVEGGPILRNFHASLGPKVLKMPLSEVVNMCLDMATKPVQGTLIEDVDSHLEPKTIDEFLKENDD